MFSCCCCCFFQTFSIWNDYTVTAHKRLIAVYVYTFNKCSHKHTHTHSRKYAHSVYSLPLFFATFFLIQIFGHIEVVQYADEVGWAHWTVAVSRCTYCTSTYCIVYLHSHTRIHAIHVICLRCTRTLVLISIHSSYHTIRCHRF